MKCTCEDEVVIDTQLVETVREVALVDQPTGLVDYDESKDDPE